MTSDRYSIRTYGDGIVVFDRKTGDTHALDPIHAAVFSCDLEGTDVATTLDRVIQSGGPDDERSASELIARVRSELAQLGLGAPAPGRG